MAIAGDRLELHRVFTNILGNAVKFTEGGEITVSLKAHESRAVVAIVDTGPGIEPNDLPGLFERFQQGKHKQAGSGLGLHLSRYIVEAHGGVIAVESELGQGSCFQVLLPLTSGCAS